jgi:antitoxin ParD1/3/4
MALHVSLPDGLEKLVQEEVAKGMYGTASEVVREALRRFFAPQEEPAWIAAEMRRRVALIESGKAKFRDADAFFDEMDKQIEAMPE